MGEQIAISLKNISKCYKRYASPVDRLKELLLPQKSRATEFWALQDINLDIYQGETLGIVGQNGSGKSTLLQIIAGTLTPSQGEAVVKGRVSALLELGSGFNPEFTGRQNVFFNGRLLGLTREEVEAKFDDIAAFAEIGSFIEQPVKTYSSGMALRLAFAVAASIDPDILIVDEALAVGDVKFQARCMKRIRRLRDQGTTILFVSHDTGSVISLCQRAVLLNQGTLLDVGTPKAVANRYIALLNSNGAEIDVEQQKQVEVYNNPEKLLALDAKTLLADSDVGSASTTSNRVVPQSETNLEQANNLVSKTSKDEVNDSRQNSVELASKSEAEYINDLGTLMPETIETVEIEVNSKNEIKLVPCSKTEIEIARSEENIVLGGEPEKQYSDQEELTTPDAIAPAASQMISDVSDVQVTIIPGSQPCSLHEDFHYQPQDFSPSTEEDSVDLADALQGCHLYRYGNQSAIVRSVKLFELGQLKKATTPDQQAVTKLTTGSTLDILVSLEARTNVSDLVDGVSIRNLMGLVVYGINTDIQNLLLPNLIEGQCLDINFQLPCFFNKGVYTLTVGLHSDEGLSYDWIDELVVFEVTNVRKCDGLVDLNAKIQISQPRHYTAV